MPFQPSQIFVGKANPRVEHLEVASLRKAPALPTNIGLGWQYLQGTNTLAYYESA
jgi:hypothetical protein